MAFNVVRLYFASPAGATRLSVRQAALFAVTLGVAVTAVRRTLHRNHVRNPAVWRQERSAGRHSSRTAPPLRLLSIVIGSATHTSQTRVCSLARRAVNQHGGERVDVISSVNQGNPSILRVAGVAIDVLPPSPLENKPRL